MLKLSATLSILLLHLVNSTSAYLLPLPSGKFNVTLATGPLNDYSRNDTAAGTPRELMVSIFQPATCEQTVDVPYMREQTGQYQGIFLQQVFNLTDFAHFFLDARLQICPDQASGSPDFDPPILLFSPGYSVNRLYYNVIASSIASEGFIVATIDHPGDANIITYSDGHAVYMDQPYAETNDQYDKLQDARVADISFVLDQVSNATAIAELLPERGPRPFSIDRVAILGHSLGGSTAVTAASQDDRLRAAINFDGTIFGPTPTTCKPVQLVSRDATADGFDPSWNATWARLTGPKLWTEVAETSHYTFSDVPTLLQAAGEDLAGYASLLGSVSPDEILKIMTGYTTAWMHGAFDGDVRKELSQLSKFPEVSIVREGNF